VIRINLLPQKREIRTTETDNRWLIVLLGVVLLEIIAILLFHQMKREELAKQIRANQEISAQIEQIKKSIANHADIKAQLENLRLREDAIAKLLSARTGPTAVLLELSQMLTVGRGPTTDQDVLAQLRKDNPSAVYNPGWDARRLWITNYQDMERTVKIEGFARDGDDVSELARRLGLSIYFTDVRLMPATRGFDQESKSEVIRFQLQAKAQY
jgi:type IV pilus assembly protein PilN